MISLELHDLPKIRTAELTGAGPRGQIAGDGSQAASHRSISTRHSSDKDFDDPFRPIYVESVSRTRQGNPELPLYGISMR